MDITADNTTPQIAPTFRLQWEAAQDCYVVLYPEGMVKLNPSAGEIMKRITGDQTVGDIIADLKEAFPDADIEQDVRKFMEVAHENGWIRAKQ